MENAAILIISPHLSNDVDNLLAASTGCVLFCCHPVVQVCATYCSNESPSYAYYATQWGQEVSEVCEGSLAA